MRIILGVLLFMLSVLFGSSVFAKIEYFTKEKARDASVTCVTCHSSVPKAGDADQKLNDAGKHYKAHKELPKK